MCLLLNKCNLILKSTHYNKVLCTSNLPKYNHMYHIVIMFRVQNINLDHMNSILEYHPNHKSIHLLMFYHLDIQFNLLDSCKLLDLLKFQMPSTQVFHSLLLLYLIHKQDNIIDINLYILFHLKVQLKNQNNLRILYSFH